MIRFTSTIAYFLFLSLLVFDVQAQNSVGIGTPNPNENAVLELVSPNGDQGLLVPKLTTAERNAPAFLSRLTSIENGLLVFDSDEGQFYYWQDTQWQKINNGVDLVAGPGIDISGNTITNLGDSDMDPSNEIQDLQLTGNTLTITNNATATPVDLSGIAGVDAQTLAVQKTGSDVDVSISNGNTVVVNIDDADPDATNELQDLSLTGTDLSITSGSTIDLSGFLTDNDNQTATAVPVNPGGNLTSTDVQAALEELQTDIDSDIDTDPTNEIQNALGVPVTPTGNLVSTDVQAAFVELQGDIDSDLDQDATNEIQNISLAGNSVGIDGGGLGFDLTPSAPSPNQVMKWDGIQWVAGSDDTGVGTLPALADAQLITNNGSNIAVTVSGDINMDNSGVMNIQPSAITSSEIQDGSVADTDIDNTANISASKLQSSVMVEGEDLSLLNNDSGFLTVVNNSDITSLDPSKLTQAGATNGQALKWNNILLTWEPANDLVDDPDNDPANEYQDLTLATDLLGLTNSAGTIDLSGYLDNTDSQNAGQVEVTPLGNLTSTNTQAALEELQGDIDLDSDTDPANEFNISGSLEANNLLRINDGGGPIDIDISRLSGNLDANTYLINNLTDPSTAQDAATKAYVDGQLSLNAWGTGGNLGTTPGIDFVGTSDAQDLVLATNSTSRMRIFDGTGNVSIGGTSSYNKLTTTDAVSTSVNQGAFIDIHNTQGLNNAMAGIRLKVNGVTTNDRFGAGIWHRFNSAYELVFAVKSNATATNVSTSDIKMVIRDNGNVGIGNLTPASTLDVNGVIKSSGIQMTTTPGLGYVLTSDATGIGSWQPVPSQFSTLNNIPKGNGTGLVNSNIYSDAAGHVGINQVTPTSGLHVVQDDGALFAGNLGSGSIPTTGSGTRMMWYPRKAAFRAGRTTGTDWDDANIANYSVALGYNGIANGEAAVSVGYDNDVQAFRSVGIGTSNVVNQQQSFAAGVSNVINGQQSLALGVGNTAGGQFSGAIGWDAVTSQDSAFAIGAWVEASSRASYVIGKGVNAANPLINNNQNSLMVGFYSTVPTFYVGPGFGTGSIGRVGIGTSSPAQTLDVNGAIKIGNGISIPGSIRWDGSDFHGYNGAQWLSLTGSSLWSPSGSNAYFDSGIVSIGNNSPAAGNQLEIDIPTTNNSEHTGLIVNNNYVGGSGSQRGILTNVGATDLNSWKYGTHNNVISSIGSSGWTYGSYNTLVTEGTGNHYGTYNNVGSLGTGVKYGIYNQVGGAGISSNPIYGVNNSLDHDGSGDIYGLYTDYATSSTSGTKYGIAIEGDEVNYLNGRLGIGTTNPSASYQLHVDATAVGRGIYTRNEFNAGNSYGQYYYMNNTNGANNVYGIYIFSNGVAGTGTEYGIYSIGTEKSYFQGDIDYTGVLNDVSDVRLKENIALLEDSHGKLMELNGYSFTMIDDPDNRVEYGVIAQEIQKVFPELVSVNEDDFLIVNVVGLIAPLIESAKTLDRKVERLNEENRNLKEQLHKQKNQISEIYTLLVQLTSSEDHEVPIDSEIRSTGDEK